MSQQALKDNGDAYETWEVRNGPPLDYIAEKLRHAVEQFHGLIGAIDRYVPANLPVPERAQHGFSVKDDTLLRPAHAGFYDALKAYLALRNRLALMDEPSLVADLLALPRAEFRVWLDELDESSSVLG